MFFKTLLKKWFWGTILKINSELFLEQILSIFSHFYFLCIYIEC